MELRSGYEIFLKNPRNADPALLSNFSFTFINIRERLLAQREAGSANNKTINFVSHIEEKYIIGDQIGSGMSGQVHKCINRETKQQCAVKIIDTRKFALTPGSPSHSISSSVSESFKFEFDFHISIFAFCGFNFNIC